MGSTDARALSEYTPYIPVEKGIDPETVDSFLDRGEPKVHTGDELRYLAMPCGGIGAGQLEICGDGKLGAWWVFNQSPPANGGLGYASGGRYINPANPEHPVEHGFAVEVHSGSVVETCILDSDGFDALEFVGQYPIASLTYKRSFQDFPLGIRSSVYSPFIPLNLRDSANPGTILRFTFTNQSDESLKFRSAGWLQNTGPAADGTRRVNRVLEGEGYRAVLLGVSGSLVHETSPQFGTMSIGMLRDDANGNADFQGLSKLFEGKDITDSKESDVDSELLGAVCSPLIDLSPGEERNITFVIGWYYPNLENNEKGCPGRVGHIYNNWYDSATDVVAYFAKNESRLYSETRCFHDSYYNSSLPHWLLTRISAPLTNLSAQNIAIWENGRLYAYEGVSFCLGTCGHVYNFATAIAYLFPELERSVRLMQDLAFAYDPDSGRVNTPSLGGQRLSRRNLAESEANHRVHDLP